MIGFLKKKDRKKHKELMDYRKKVSLVDIFEMCKKYMTKIIFLRFIQSCVKREQEINIF